MSRIDPSVFRNWNDGDIMHESDYEQERQILYTAINDNYDRLVQKYDKTEVDALLNAMKGAGWTNAITIKGNYDLIQSIINAYATDAEVDAIRATLQSQITQNTNDIANRYTKAETDAKDANLQSQITFLSANKTDKTGDHQGTWQGLTPPQIGAGDMNASRLDYLEDVRIPAIEGQLDENDKYPVTLLPGLQIITVPQGTPFNVLNLKGRTLINLLGRSGGCESTGTPWNFAYNAVVTLDATNKTTGQNGFKVAINTGQTQAAVYQPTIDYKAGKYYVGIADVKNGNATGGVRIYSHTANSQTITDTTKFNTVWFKLNPVSDVSAAHFGFHVLSGSAGQYGYVDSMRLYEISAAEYAALDSMTPEQIAAKYPYVDDFKPIRGAYLIRYGKNLLPPFTEWTSYGIGTVVTNAYKTVINATAQNFAVGYRLPCVPNATYTFSAQHNGVMALQTFDASGNLLNNNGGYQQVQQLSITTTANDKYIGVLLGNGSLPNGTYTFTNPMLNIGSNALPFEPQNNDYIFIDGTFHGMNGVSDEVVVRDGKVSGKLKRFEELILDGSLNYSFVADYAGFKSVKVPVSNYVNGNGTVTNNTVVKYDGKIILRKSSIDSGADVHTDTTTELYLSIADTDSGWGENYTPTVQEIQAYFLGWKMYLSGSGFNSSYNGTGTKAWVERYQMDNGNTEAGTTDFNVVKSSIDTNKFVWSMDTRSAPYKLVYQLATPVEVPVTSEGEISLFEGDNLLEVGTGVVIREAVNVNYNGTFYQINSNTKPLANKTNKILNVYKGTSNDTPLWTLGQTGDSATWNGGGYAYTTPDKYDPSATYSVTYLVLDRYLYTAPLIDLQAEYRTKLAGVVAELAQDLADVATRVSVVETQYARKQQGQWIAPVLLNGWVNHGNGFATAGYMKDEFGFVHIKGMIKSGATTAGTVIATLPKGYRPKEKREIVTVCFSPASVALLSIYSTGDIVADVVPYNTWLSLELKPFLAEQ